MHKLTTNPQDTIDQSIGVDRDRNRRKRELTNNKNTKGNYHLIIMLKNIFGLAEYQEKATFGLGYKLTLTRNTDNAVLNKDSTINNAENKTNAIEW